MFKPRESMCQNLLSKKLKFTTITLEGWKLLTLPSKGLMNQLSITTLVKIVFCSPYQQYKKLKLKLKSSRFSINFHHMAYKVLGWLGD